jgi:hypothetical protein
MIASFCSVLPPCGNLQSYKARGIQLILTNPSPRVVRLMERSGLINKIGRDWIFVRVHDAVSCCCCWCTACLQQLLLVLVILATRRRASCLVTRSAVRSML